MLFPESQDCPTPGIVQRQPGSTAAGALAANENNVHNDSGGKGGGVLLGSFGIGSSGQSGTSSFSRTKSFR